MIKGLKSIFPLVVLVVLMQLAYIAAQSARAGIYDSLDSWQLARWASNIAAFFIATAPVLIAEIFWPREAVRRRWLLPSLIWIFTITFRVVTVLVVFRAISPYMPAPLIRLDLPPGQHAVLMPLVLICYRVAAEFFKYWKHRAFHEVGWLWRIHKPHHVTRDMTALNSVQHFLSEPIHLVLVTIPMMLLIKMDATDILIFSAVFASWNAYIHANTTANWGGRSIWLADNEYHRVHHSEDPAHHNKNYAALFPFLDVLFGTYCQPTGERLVLGIKGQPEPATFLEHALMPFRRSGVSGPAITLPFRRSPRH